MEGNNLLEMKQINKQFVGVHALDHVDFSVRPGEIHALMGENGAGKSTLIKVLTGLYSKDGGEVFFDGKMTDFKSPQDSQKAGISTIYQEINLIPYMSVTENILVGSMPRKYFGIDWKTANRKAEEVLADLGIHIDVTEPLNTYSTALQQMIAIGRALYSNAKLLIMDEPTSSLASDEVKELMGHMRNLKAKGIAIIFISHKLDEIFEISDRVTILRDGKLVGTREIEGLTQLEMVSMMIGRDATAVMEQKAVSYRGDENALPVLEAKNIENDIKLHGISLKIRPGEIVGLAGLLGAGKTEFAKVIFGSDNTAAGSIEINGKPVRFTSPKGAIGEHIAYCSEDRKAEGIFPHMSVAENMTIAILPQISRFGIVDRKKQAEIVDKYIEDIKIKTPSPEQQICNLSGGNQQKVLLGRWLSMDPKLIILDEPTRGIDVGAKDEIEKRIQEFSANNISVLYISSEIEELMRNCHKIVVIRDGKSVGELTGADINKDSIMSQIAQGSGV